MQVIAALLVDERATTFVKYSSLALLVVIAALAVLSETGGHLIN